MKRKRISTKARLAIFERHSGECHLCKGKVQAGEAWDVSHEIPLELLGADDETNWRVAHRKCHRAHTSTVDIPAIAKAKRREAIDKGAKAPPAKPLQSPGFAPKAAKPSTARQPDKLAALPRRAMFR
jgi:5-methylcytosine-specific restriction protein A